MVTLKPASTGGEPAPPKCEPGLETLASPAATPAATMSRASEDVLIRGGTSRGKSTTAAACIFRVTDPLGFPPCEYNAALFQCNYPLVFPTSVMPLGDPFGAFEMDPETRLVALDVLLRPAYKVAATHDIKGELGARHLHTALFDNLGLLTRPSHETLSELEQFEEDMEYCRLLLDQPKRIKLDCPTLVSLLKEAACHHEDSYGVSQLDYCMQAIEVGRDTKGGEEEPAEQKTNDGEETRGSEAAETKSSSPGSQKSFHMEDETVLSLGDSTGRGRVDNKIFVFSHSNREIKVKLNYMPMVSSKRCVCIAECRWEDDDDDAFYQAAAYACQEAFANMTNLHFVAIYVLVLAKTKWRYGILRPQGWVEVVNGRINKDNIERFHQQQQQVPEFPCFSVPTLETRLEEATQYYREYYSWSPKANYPNDRYLVGTLHICQKWFKLPVFDGENKMDVARFYEGLLKIVVGKRVITWTPKDVYGAKKLRKGMLKIRRRLGLATHSRKCS